VALSDAEVEGLRRRAWLAREGGVPADWLDAGETKAIEPSLTDAVRASLLIHRDVQVDAQALARALLAATRGAGVEILPGREAKGIRWRDGDVEGVQLADGSVMRGRRVLLAAGAWSGTLEGLPFPLPVRPVKGQMLSVEPGHRLALDRVVESDDVYLVPTTDRGILIGATVEEVGFDKSNTEEGLRGLLASATGLCPALEGATVLETWAGLRPGTPDGLPVIGTFPGKEGLLAATGHHRNGILLAPATARAIVSLLTDPTAIPVPSELSPARFAPRPIPTAHDP
jgi:glycine/D-amino acid oxidase-like deaminating enzyme